MSIVEGGAGGWETRGTNLTKIANDLKNSENASLPRVVVFGTGRSGQNYLRSSNGSVEVAAVVDHDPSLWDTRFADHILLDPARIPSLSFDSVVVTTAWVKEVSHQLVDAFRVPVEKILFPPKEVTAGDALKNSSLRSSLEDTIAKV